MRPENNENDLMGYKPSPNVPLSVPVTSVIIELAHRRSLAMLATEGSLEFVCMVWTDSSVYRDVECQ